MNCKEKPEKQQKEFKEKNDCDRDPKYQKQKSKKEKQRNVKNNMGDQRNETKGPTRTGFRPLSVPLFWFHVYVHRVWACLILALKQNRAFPLRSHRANFWQGRVWQTSFSPMRMLNSSLHRYCKGLAIFSLGQDIFCNRMLLVYIVTSHLTVARGKLPLDIPSWLIHCGAMQNQWHASIKSERCFLILNYGVLLVHHCESTGCITLSCWFWHLIGGKAVYRRTPITSARRRMRKLSQRHICLLLHSALGHRSVRSFVPLNSSARVETDCFWNVGVHAAVLLPFFECTITSIPKRDLVSTALFSTTQHLLIRD